MLGRTGRARDGDERAEIVHDRIGKQRCALVGVTDALPGAPVAAVVVPAVAEDAAGRFVHVAAAHVVIRFDVEHRDVPASVVVLLGSGRFHVVRIHVEFDSRAADVEGEQGGFESANSIG